MLNYPDPQPPSTTLRSRSQAYMSCTDVVLVKVSKSLYILIHLIEVFDTLLEVSYWSKLLQCIISTSLSHKLRYLIIKFLVIKVLQLHLLMLEWIYWIIDTGVKFYVALSNPLRNLEINLIRSSTLCSKTI